MRSIIPELLVGAFFCFVSFGVGVNCSSEYVRVDRCQHDGLTRKQCWCIEKSGERPRGGEIRKCFTGSP